jgi:hypothetical protein
VSLPDHRPPTKAECWEHWKEYFGPDKDFDWLVGFARSWWTRSYVVAVCLTGWTKQPNWSEGDPVIPEAVGTPEMFAETRGRWGNAVEALYRKAQERAA